MLDKDKITSIKNNMECPKDFLCITSNLTDLCNAKDFGLQEYVDCKDTSPQKCSFSLSFGDGYLCKCPMRIYIEKNL